MAFGVCVPVGIVVGLVVERWVVRPLRSRSASAISLLLVTIGVTQVLLALALIPDLGPDRSKLVSVGYPLPFSAFAASPRNSYMTGANINVDGGSDFADGVMRERLPAGGGREGVLPPPDWVG